MPSLVLPHLLPMSLSCLGQQVCWGTVLNTVSVRCDISYCSSLWQECIVSWADVQAWKLFSGTTWGTPWFQTDSSEGIRSALLLPTKPRQQRQCSVFTWGKPSMLLLIGLQRQRIVHRALCCHAKAKASNCILCVFNGQIITQVWIFY